MAVGAVLAGLVGPTVVRRFGRGAALRLGLAGLALGLSGYLVATAVWLTLAGTLVAGTFGSSVVNTHSAVLSHHHRESGDRGDHRSERAGRRLRPHRTSGDRCDGRRRTRLAGGSAAAAAFVVMAATARTAVPAGPQSVPVRPRLRPHPDGDGAALPTPFWPALAVLVLCNGAEFALTFWASDLLRERAGASAAVATACIPALVLGMTVRRAAGPPGLRAAGWPWPTGWTPCWGRA